MIFYSPLEITSNMTLMLSRFFKRPKNTKKSIRSSSSSSKSSRIRLRNRAKRIKINFFYNVIDKSEFFVKCEIRF